MISPRFIKRVNANLNYWLATSQQVSDATLTQLDKERHNLHRAVEYGLQIPETAVTSARLVHQLFPFIEKCGYWTEWLPILNRAMTACAITDTYLQLPLMNQLGFIQRLHYRLDQAAATHMKVVELAEKHGQHKDRAEALFHLSNTYYDSHQYVAAQQCADQALAAFKALGLESDAKKMAAIFNVMGLLAQVQGDYATAQNRFVQSISNWQKTNEKTYLARTLYNLGNNFLAQEKFEDALLYYNKASMLLESTASKLDQVYIDINRGHAYFEMGNWHKAKEAYRQANSPSLQQSGDKYHQALIANNLGCVFMKQEQWTTALSYLQASEKLWKSIDNQLMLGNTRGSLGETMAALQHNEHAHRNYQLALEALSNYPENAFAQSRLEEIRELYSVLDNPKE